MEYQEIRYEKENYVARITIDRPKRYNACNTQAVQELIDAFTRAWVEEDVGVVVLTGAGEKAFCTGGDQTTREKGGYQGGEEPPGLWKSDGSM